MTIAATLFCVVAVVIIAGRIRYDRRRDLFARIAQLVDGSAARPDDPELQSQISHALRGWKLRTIERAMAEGQGASAVLHGCAVWLLERVGESRLVVRAARGTPRWRRVAALRILAFARPDLAWPLLERGLADDDREIRRGVAVILGRIPHRRSAELLVNVLREGRQPRSQTAVLLQACPVDIGDLLMPLLGDRDPALRYWGAVLAGGHPPLPSAEERLVALTADAEPSVRKAALDSLAAGGFLTALPAVLRRLDDPAPFVRAHAARALGQLGAVDAVSVLVERLGDSDWWVRDAVKRSLVALADREEGLALHGTGFAARQPRWAARTQQDFRGGLPRRQIESVLLAHLSNEDAFARNGAAEVLQHLGTFERLLVEEAQGPPNARRREALAKLADAGGLRVWEAVVPHLTSETRLSMSDTVAMLELRAAAAEPPLTS